MKLKGALNWYILLLNLILLNTGIVMAQTIETATLGGGCFWCTEAIFERLNGVTSVVSGYAGGKTEDPTYEAISSGSTGHAEVIQVKFDPKIVSFSEILEVFFHLHDPTTLNRQGADRGTQYRSIILYHSDEQKSVSETVIKKITDQRLWPDPIVTEIKPLDKFYTAEEYHQNYYNQNKSQPYCSLVIGPKIMKLQEKFKDKLKK